MSPAVFTPKAGWPHRRFLAREHKKRERAEERRRRKNRPGFFKGRINVTFEPAIFTWDRPMPLPKIDIASLTRSAIAEIARRVGRSPREVEERLARDPYYAMELQRELEAQERPPSRGLGNFVDYTISVDGMARMMAPPRSREDELAEALEQARRKLREMEEFNTKLMAEPMAYAIVLGRSKKNPDKVMVRRGAETLEVTCAKALEVGPGDVVRLLVKTMNVVDAAAEPPTTGDVLSVRRVIDDTTCEIAVGPLARAVYVGRHKVVEGDRVVLDPTGSIVLRNLGQPPPPPQVMSPDANITWDDIGGQEAAKRALQEAIEWPIVHAELYKRYGKRPSRGVLLSGPPGNGKTMLGKACATAIAKLHAQKAHATGFAYVAGPELLDKFVGESEANVRRLFENARAHKAAHGYPAVIFIDEAEALLSRRDMSGPLVRTIVPMFLAEMDGMIDSGAFVILATNRPRDLDPAVVREGRIDAKVHLGRPGRDDAREVFIRHLRTRPLAGDVAELAVDAVEYLFDARHTLYRLHMAKGPPKAFGLQHLTSGAQIAEIAQRATQHAIRRDLEAKKATAGICVGDLRDAVDSIFVEQRGLDHRDALAEFVEALGQSAQSIEVVKPSKAVA